MRRTIDQKKLENVLERSGHSFFDLAEVLGISHKMLTDKISGRNNLDFLYNEMDTIKERYSLSAQEAISLFFP